MIQHAAEGFQSNLALADMLVPVDTRTERRLGIVCVNQADAVKPDRAIDIQQRFFQSRFGPDIPAGREKVRRVHANTQRQVRGTRR